MKALEFLQAFHDYSVTRGFSFCFDDKQFQQPDKMGSGAQTLMAISFGVAALGLVNPGGFYENFTNEVFIEDMRKLKNHCDLIAVKD